MNCVFNKLLSISNLLTIRSSKLNKNCLNCLIPSFARKSIKKIPIVSHSNYIRDEIMVNDLIRRKEEKYLKRNKKLNNNQILKKEYQYDNKKIYVRDQIIYDFGCVYEDRIVDCYH